MIDAVATALQAVGIDAAPSSQADPSLADTALSMTNLLSTLVSGNAYPLTLPERPALPNAVYQPQARSFVEADGYLLGRIDVYVASLRAATFAAIQQLTEQFDAAVADHTGQVSIDVMDAAADFEAEQQQYRAHFEVQVTTLATRTPSLPAAFIHHVESVAERPAVMNAVDQDVTEYLAVVLVAEAGTLDAQRQAAAGALLGLEQPDALAPLEYVSGQQVAVAGRHVYWRELYRWSRRIDRQ